MGRLIGGITIAKIECSNRKIALMSVYAPNQFDADFYRVLTDVMLQLADYTFIVGSDFNAVWDPAVDRSGASETSDQRQSLAVPQSWARNTGLIDMWRMVNPSLRDFSFFSSRHKTFSSRVFPAIIRLRRGAQVFLPRLREKIEQVSKNK